MDAIFQLTASRGGWRMLGHSFGGDVTFQLTASRRGWHAIELYQAFSFLFQLTASRRGWLEGYKFSQHDSHFNSQPHEEADWCSVSVRNNVHISTHSLTKRLTFFCFFLSECFHISTHSLTKRLTVWRVFRIADYSHFNSQPHEEADIRCSYNNVVYFISTHSLTKRLTVMEYRESKEDTFQLTASRRGWLTTLFSEAYAQDISTHSLTKRLTRNADLAPGYELVFQLTASRRGWQWGRDSTLRHFFISTHSLTKRLTAEIVSPETISLYFNSQPHEEADAGASFPAHSLLSFQLTASRRGWPEGDTHSEKGIYFNSQPHEEADGSGTFKSV